MGEDEQEEKLLRSVALQNASSILAARERIERELLQAKEALELKTAELIQQREWFQVTLSSIGDAVITTDIAGHVTFLNPIAEAMTGWKASEAAGLPLEKVFVIINEVTRQLAVNPVHTVLREGIIVELSNHTTLVARDGTEVAIEDSAAPIKDAQGKISGAVMVFHNVTERRRADDALREETRILELLNQTGIAIAAELDLQSLVQAVTDSATVLSGAKFGAFFYNVTNERGESFVLYTLSGAPREAFEKFGLPRNTPIFNPTFRGAGVVRSADITQDPRYGTMAPHHGMPQGHLPVRSYLAAPVISRSGEVIGGLFFGHPEPGIFTARAERVIVGVAAQAAVAIDNARLYEAAQKQISERRLAEEALARQVRLTVMRAEVSAVLATTDQLPSVLQHCADLLLKYLPVAAARIWTADPLDRFLELRASASLEAQPVKLPTRLLIGEGHIGRIAQTRRHYFADNLVLEQPEGGSEKGLIAFAGYPLIVEDHLVGVLGLYARQSFTDEALTELSLVADGLAQWMQRKSAEQSLREAQDKLSRHAVDLERQVAERTALLRETIGELEAFSYSISHDMRAPLRAMQSFALILAEECAPEISPAGKGYIRRITNAAERMDRLIQDVLTYSRVARTDLPLETIQVEKLLRDILDSYPMFEPPAAMIQLQGEFPPVRAAEAVLTQCISNLLGNAVKFVAPGVTPQIRIWAEAGRDETMVRILFEDNGLGIKKESHEAIFAIFQRVSNNFEGTGIGLAIVKKGIERMGGQVGLVSAPEKGSTFWLELQRAPVS